VLYDELGPDTPIHFLRLCPDYKMTEFGMTPIETLEKHHVIAREEGLRYAYIRNVLGIASSTAVKGDSSIPTIHLKTEVTISPISVIGTIVEYVERKNIDLIVMGTRGRSGLPGSTASGDI